MTPTLIVMVKEPRPGRVKTRLGRSIGLVQAAWWVRHQNVRLFRCLRSRRWQLAIAVSPDVEGMQSRIWPADLPRLRQGRGDLGDRMTRVMRAVTGPVCIIGADIPAIRPEHIARAFKALGDHDFVFGPAEDGGYWLIGAKHPRHLPAGFLAVVRWSTEHTLADSRATLPGKRVALIDTLADVDEVDDLR